ncbi:penicillin-binding protein 2 [bacterium]|nr:penicillin-binding protein 2 [bacterium]
MNVKSGKVEKVKDFDKRLGCWQVAFAVFAIGLIIHLFFIQVIDLKKLRIKAKKQRSAQSFVMRGDIYDRNGIKLASDRILFDVYARTPDYEHTPEELANMLAPILKIPKSTLVQKLRKRDIMISLKKNVDRQTRDEIAKLHLREIPMDKKTIRVYPQGVLAAHVLGYYNFDADISAGIEETAKDRLELVDQNILIEKTPKGDIIYGFNTDPLATTRPMKGEDITLTIDTAIQHVCEQELLKVITKTKALRGTVIVLNPKNGEILAYAVYPYYDPNNYKKATYNQIKNWPLTDVFPPGSTFKVITVASAMDLGKINKSTKINDTGKIKVGWWDIENYDYRTRPNPGMIDLVYLFEHSSNVASVKVAQMMTSKEFYDMLKKFGIGAITGIDLPGESRGLLKLSNKWDSADHASMGYGYGASVTAIQMVAAVSALANNGVRVTPHVIKYTPEEAESKIQYTQVLKPETARDITQLLMESINRGKSPIKMDKYNVAAKTGTSKKPKEDGSGYTSKYYTSTIGYLPATDPEILIYVMVDSAQGGNVWGSTIAAPIFKEISSQVARIMNLKPDKNVDSTKSDKEI